MRSLLTASILTLALALPAAAQTAAPAPAKDAAQAAKDAAAATGQAVKDGAKAAGETVKDGAKAAGETVKDAAKATGQAVSNAAAATGAAVSHAAAAVSAKLEDLKDGWTLRHGVIDQPVYDDKNARIGEIDDLVLTGDAQKGYHVAAIVGVGGFLGIGERKVATPLESLSRVDGKFVMHGVTKESLGGWPEYKVVAPANATATAPAKVAQPAPKQ